MRACVCVCVTTKRKCQTNDITTSNISNTCRHLMPIKSSRDVCVGVCGSLVPIVPALFLALFGIMSTRALYPFSRALYQFFTSTIGNVWARQYSALFRSGRSDLISKSKHFTTACSADYFRSWMTTSLSTPSNKSCLHSGLQQKMSPELILRNGGKITPMSYLPGLLRPPKCRFSSSLHLLLLNVCSRCFSKHFSTSRIRH